MTRFFLITLLLLALCALWGLRPALAEATLAERNGWQRDTRFVVPKLAKPPVIDGHIDLGEWAGAAEFNAQVSQWGHNLYARQNIWYLGWDEGNLYLASRTPLAVNERPRRNARTLVGTAVMSDDTLEVWLDPKGRNAGNELASYFQSMVNALGITYFARLYPQVGAKSDNWDPHWKIAASISDQYMDIEIQMPVAGFGLTKNQAGDVWGMMLARNYMFENWNQSPMIYEFPNFGFAVNTYYPLMTLRDDSPYVKFHSPVALFNGNAYANADILNPTATAQRVKVQLTIGDGKQTLFTDEKVLELPAGSRTTR